MKKFFFLLTAIAALAALKPTHSLAQEGFYTGGFGGADIINTNKHNEKRLDFDTGYTLAGFVGYRWHEGLRVEGEVSYRRDKLRSVEFEGIKFLTNDHMNTWAGMANMLFDIDIGYWNSCCFNVMPYVGVGVGYAHQSLNVHSNCTSGDEFRITSKSGFAWQVITGITYRLNPCVDLSVEYRLMRGHMVKLYSNSIGLTAKYHFPR
jgi:opacity protein-like surface antigen